MEGVLIKVYVEKGYDEDQIVDKDVLGGLVLWRTYSQ